MAIAEDVPITLETLESLFQFVEGESNLASLSKEMTDLLSEMEGNMTDLERSQAGATTNSKLSSSGDALNLLRDLVETISLDANQSSSLDLTDEISQALKNNLGNENDLVRGLGLVKTILEQREISGVPKNLKDLLMNKSGEMEKELAGQQISNVMSRLSEDSNVNFYYLSFPLKIDDQYSLAEIKISKDKGKKSLADMDNIKLVVSLDTSKLGLVLFHVEWHKDTSLKIEGLVEKEIALEYMEGNVNKLIEDLESRDYLVDYRGIKVSTNGREDMRLKLEEKDEVVGTFEIDIWV